METAAAVALPSHRKRRRRRREDKRAISARLALDDQIAGDVGILSEDLFADLFPHLRDQDLPLSSSDPDQQQHIRHVAIAPWTPDSSPETTSWTIVPVAKSTALAHSTVQFSPSALALQNFAADLERVAPSKLSGHGRSRSGIDILVLDVLALSLDTVFVSLDGELAKRLEDGEGTFFREHPTTPTLKTPIPSNTTADGRLAEAVRAALGTLKVVHTGDLFPLPLPPHPITHVPPNPGKVTLCEPVAQGLLSPDTKIVVSRGRSQSKGNRMASSSRPNRILNGVNEDDEDTANDQFYSAAEERYKTEATDTAEDSATATTSGSDSDPLSSAEHDDLSDDSMDDMISLQTPTLPTTSAASGFSTMQAGTPMTLGRGRRTNGIATPGSVFSSFTATTARPGRLRGRLFKAQGLVRPIPSELLHPRPTPEDDEEAHIYVDVTNLSRIGCFSGDWVRVEASAAPPANGFGPFALGGFGEPDEEEPNWRPARVFGLPEGYSRRPVTRIPSSKHSSGRRLSFFESQIQKPSSPTAYASPILLANLDGPSHVRLLPLKRAAAHHRHNIGGGPHSQTANVMQPPYAREVIIQQLRTPVSSSRDLQVAVMAGLKWHFEKKLRVLKAGDLIAVPIDSQLGRTMHEASPLGGEGSAIDDILSLAAGGTGGSELTTTPRRRLKHDEVAWFKVANVQAQKQPQDAATAAAAAAAAADADHEMDEEDPWAAAARVDASLTRLESSGSVTGRVPGTKDSNWPYYLGLLNPPPPPAHGGGPESSSSPPAAIADPSSSQRYYVSRLRRRMRELLAAATSKRAVHLKMPPVAILLSSTQRNMGKAALAVDACRDIGLHAFEIDAFDVLNGDHGGGGGGGGDVKTDASLRARAERALSCGPEACALLIRHVEALTADRVADSLRAILAGGARALVATTTDPEKIPDGVRGLFTHELEMSAPDEAERAGILRSVVDRRGVALDPEVDLGSVALKTAALVAGDLVDVVERAVIARRARLEQLAEQQQKQQQHYQNGTAAAAAATTAVSVRDVHVAGGPSVRGLTRADFDAAVDAARKNFSDAIGAPKIPNVTWDDVGGLGAVKDAVTETIQLPLERPELFAKGMKKRSGILFYGPPGTGKTLLAKAIATEYSLNFFSVKGPELLNMYIGESEANVRRVFQRARDARPCVVFFDELDSVAPKRGNQGDSGGVMDRIVSQLLAELDGMSSSSSSSGGGGKDEDAASGSGGVFVIGATNRPDLLDPALLRPGRFDKLLYLGVSDTHEKQLKIMEALTRKFTLHPTVSLRTISEKLPFSYTGADFYALCSDAMLKAVTRQAAQVDAKIRAMNQQKAITAAPGQGQGHHQHQQHHQGEMSTAYFFDHHATPNDIAVMVTEADFMAAHHELVPSVSAGELAHYERVRATFEGGRDRQTLSAAAAAGVGNEAYSNANNSSHQHQPALPPLALGGSRTVSGSSIASTVVVGKGKGKAAGVATTTAPIGSGGFGKGKGKATAVSSDEEDGESGASGMNGRALAMNKGKGKAPFFSSPPPLGSRGLNGGEGHDDEGLYDD